MSSNAHRATYPCFVERAAPNSRKGRKAGAFSLLPDFRAFFAQKHSGVLLVSERAVHLTDHCSDTYPRIPALRFLRRSDLCSPEGENWRFRARFATLGAAISVTSLKRTLSRSGSAYSVSRRSVESKRRPAFDANHHHALLLSFAGQVSSTGPHSSGMICAMPSRQ